MPAAQCERRFRMECGGEILHGSAARRTQAHSRQVGYGGRIGYRAGRCRHRGNPRVLKDAAHSGKTYTITVFDMWGMKDGKADEHWDCAIKM
jgi:hypothetical protein